MMGDGNLQTTSRKKNMEPQSTNDGNGDGKDDDDGGGGGGSGNYICEKDLFMPHKFMSLKSCVS